MTNPEIEELKSLVEQKYGKLLATTTDFEIFTLQLEKATGKSVSASSLKRLYGYVGDSHSHVSPLWMCWQNILAIKTI